MLEVTNGQGHVVLRVCFAPSPRLFSSPLGPPPRGQSGKDARLGSGGPGFQSCFALDLFPGGVMPVISKLVLQGLPRPFLAPGVIGSALGLVSQVSVC